jgi:hypothetical protein
MIRDLAADPNPHNRYTIAQLIGYAVAELMRPKTNWLDSVAEVKRVGFGEKAEFNAKQEGIRAFIQAKGATTARTKVANKRFSPETLAVSARPVIHLIELVTGQAQMADLISDAAYQMELAQYGLIQRVLHDAAAAWAAPYYATGAGVVKATLDPIIRHWMRLSGGGAPVILGDIEVIGKLSELTGFTAGTGLQQYADALIMQHNAAGYIGKYNGANVVNLVNPYVVHENKNLFDLNKLYVFPAGASVADRPLKVVFEGGVLSQENTDINDKSFEVRLDQHFGAAVVYGDYPMVSVYEDSSV